jgi:hypothetical protein
MTHQGHSLTTFTCGFTQPGGNDSGKVRRNLHQSGKGYHRGHNGITAKDAHAS